MLTFLLIGFVSALMSSVSISGSALFATPLLLYCGVGLPAVLASNQFSAALWTPIAARNYLKESELDLKLVIGIGLIGCIGAWFGYQVVVLLPIEFLKNLIGVIILLIVVIVFLRDSILEGGEVRRSSFLLPLLLGLPLGAYQSIFGSGNTLFSTIMFCRTCSLDLARAIAHSYSVAFFWCTFSAFLFYWKGWMIWEVALPASVGSILGAQVGSKIGSSLSATSLRRVFLFVGAAMGLKLIFTS